MVGKLVPFTEIYDFKPAAAVLRDSLILPENADIGLEFPVAMERFTGDLNTVAANLNEVKKKCAPGVREQFIVMASHLVAGMSVVQLVEEVPAGLPADWPNVSGFILHEYRRQGLGRLSLDERLEIVDSNFGGHAWTSVRHGNEASKKLVESCGFKPFERVEQKTYYTYTKNT